MSLVPLFALNSMRSNQYGVGVRGVINPEKLRHRLL
jgi:hypothetical protein